MGLCRLIQPLNQDDRAFSNRSESAERVAAAGFNAARPTQVPTRSAYNFPMVFVELTPFIEFRETHWTDDDFLHFQRHLIRSPNAGNLIPGGAGIRKVRWLAPGRGKRGGARIVYFWHVAGSQIFLIHGYVKVKTDDLTKDQISVLAKLTKDLHHG